MKKNGTLSIYAHTCKIWISPVSDSTHLNILGMMNSPEKGDSSGLKVCNSMHCTSMAVLLGRVMLKVSH